MGEDRPGKTARGAVPRSVPKGRPEGRPHSTGDLIPRPGDPNLLQADPAFLRLGQPSPLQCDRFRSTRSGITVRPGAAEPFTKADVEAYFKARNIPKNAGAPDQFLVDSLEFITSKE